MIIHHEGFPTLVFLSNNYNDGYTLQFFLTDMYSFIDGIDEI